MIVRVCSVSVHRCRISHRKGDMSYITDKYGQSNINKDEKYASED